MERLLGMPDCAAPCSPHQVIHRTCRCCCCCPCRVREGRAHHVARLVMLSPAGFHEVIPAMFKPLVYGWAPIMWYMRKVWRQRVRGRQAATVFCLFGWLFGWLVVCFVCYVRGLRVVVSSAGILMLWCMVGAGGSRWVVTCIVVPCTVPHGCRGTAAAPTAVHEQGAEAARASCHVLLLHCVVGWGAMRRVCLLHAQPCSQPSCSAPTTLQHMLLALNPILSAAFRTRTAPRGVVCAAGLEHVETLACPATRSECCASHSRGIAWRCACRRA